MGWSKIPSDDVLESLYRLRIRESDQLKNVLELCDMEIHQKDIEASLTEITDNGEKEYRSETSIAKLWRLKWENWNRSCGYESQEIKWFAISGKQKDSVQEETNAFSGTTIMSVQNQQQKPLHPLSDQHKEVEVRREKKETWEAGVRLGRSVDSRADTIWKVLAQNYLVSIGILRMSVW